MTHNTAQTSIKAFVDLLNSPEHVRNQNVRIYTFIRQHGPVCNKDIAKRTGMELGSVSRTVNTLRNKFGVIKCAYERVYEVTGKEAQFWCISELMNPAYKRLERAQAAEERKTYRIIPVVKKNENPAQEQLFGGLNG